MHGVDGLDGPIGLSISTDGNHLYVIGNYDNAVSWYERNSSTGVLSYGGVLKDGVNGVDGLDDPVSITLSANGNYSYITGFSDRSVSWYERNSTTGALTYSGILKDGVNGVDGLNGAEVVTLSPDERHAYVTAKSDNAVSWYDRNATTGALTYGGMLKDGINGVDGLDYPFGVIISADGKYAYITGKNDNAVSWFVRNATTGALTYVGMLKDGLNGVDGLNYAYSLTQSQEGNHVYVTGFSDDAINWFTRNSDTGALHYGLASGTSYKTTAADSGSNLSVQASYTDGGGNSEQVSSIVTPSILPQVLTDDNFHFAIDQWFINETYATAAYGHISDWNTTAVTDMSKAFQERTF